VELLKLLNVITVIKTRKMFLYGHINRAKESLAHLVLQAGAEGRRGRGRPKNSWLDTIPMLLLIYC